MERDDAETMMQGYYVPSMIPDFTIATVANAHYFRLFAAQYVCTAVLLIINADGAYELQLGALVDIVLPDLTSIYVTIRYFSGGNIPRRFNVKK